MAKYITGQSGNPNGRPPGSLNKRTELVKLFDQHAEELINKAVDLARQGDPNMIKFCLERIVPRVRSETLAINLPDMDMSKANAVLLFGEEIIKAVTNRLITPEQGKLLCDIAEVQRKNIETYEVSNRLAEVERVLKLRKTGDKNHA